MRRTPTWITSATLGFDRSGRRLVVVSPEAISIVDLHDGVTRRLDVRDARAAIAFDDQVWIATADDQLERCDMTGRAIGTPSPLVFAAAGVLTPAPCGPAAAVWSSTPSLALIDDFGQLVTTELPDVDLVLPLTGRRHLVARGSRLVLPSGVTTQLAATSVLGGAVMADGRSATLIVGHAGHRELVTLSLGTGQLGQRCALTGSVVRIATQRAIAIVQQGSRLLAAIDLRSSRELGTIALDRDVRDFAIDPEGRRLVVRDGGHCIEVHELAELMRRPASPVIPAAAEPEVKAAELDARAEVVVDEVAVAVRVEPPPAPAARAPAATAPAAAAPPTVCADVLVCPPLVALHPRTRPQAGDRAEMLAQLDLELHRIALWTLRAIANAWDTRRLGYGNEGKHPYELEVGAILGLGSGHACDYVAAAHERIAEHETVLAADPRWRASDTPIGALIAEFELSERAVDVLLVIAAAALWGEIARLYGILANDVGRVGIDELVVQQVLGARYGRHDIAAELEPRAPLVRVGLVHVSTRRARPFAELAVDPVVLDLLRARRPDLGDATTVRRGDRPLDVLDIPSDVLAAAVRGLARPPSGPARIIVRGRIGSGRKTLLAALASEAGRELAVIDAKALPKSIDGFVGELRRSLRGAQLAGLVPCLVDLDDVTFDEHAARDVAAEVLRLHPGPIALVAAPDSPAAFPAGHLAFELPILPESGRGEVWARALDEAGLAIADVETLAARYRIGPGMIRRATMAARERIVAGNVDSTPAIDDYLRQTRDARLSEFAHRVDRLASWSNIVLPPDILDSLRELVGRVRHRRTVFETWGMNSTMASSRGLTALFQGPPGTGKTLVAGVIARELGLELYQVDLSKVMSKWIGETERNLSQIFDAAEDGQVVLLFDEADSLFAKRTEVRSSNDRYANLEVNYLLQRLDAFEGIAILTTNLGTSIDQAFKRRMSFRLSFPFPDEETREQLWRAHLPPELPIEGELSLDALARKYQLSGGYIRNACLRAAFLAAQQETALHQHHLERAVALEFAELGKLSTGGTID